MRVELDESRCVTAGRCVVAAPDIFDQRDDGVAVVLDATPGADRHEVVRQAAAACPGLAIRLVQRTPDQLDAQAIARRGRPGSGWTTV